MFALFTQRLALLVLGLRASGDVHERCVLVRSRCLEDLHSQYHLWPDRDSGPYQLRLWFATVSGKPAVVGLEMWGIDPDQPSVAQSRAQADRAWADRGRRLTLEGDVEIVPLPQPPDTPIRSRDIRLPLDQLLQTDARHQRAILRAYQRLTPDLGLEDREPERQARLAELLASAPKPQRGRRPLPEPLLRRVLEIYHDAESEARRDPAKAVQYRLSDELQRDLKPSTVRSWIRIAKDRLEDQGARPA